MFQNANIYSPVAAFRKNTHAGLQREDYHSIYVLNILIIRGRDKMQSDLQGQKKLPYIEAFRLNKAETFHSEFSIETHRSYCVETSQ